MTGRAWAYLGAILGGGVSVAANVAHSYVPPAAAPAGWAPEHGAIGSAVFWPVGLLVAIEILARVAWPAGWRWAVVRFGGLLPVAVVAAVVSYRHLSGLLAWYAEDPLTVLIGPLAVDGLMVMATGALLATGRQPATGAAPAVTADAPELAVPLAPADTAPETITAPLAPAGALPDERQGSDSVPPETITPAPEKITAPPEPITDLAERARQAYAESVAAGAPLTAQQLAERYFRSPSWARSRIAETRKPTSKARPVNGARPQIAVRQLP